MSPLGWSMQRSYALSTLTRWVSHCEKQLRWPEMHIPVPHFLPLGSVRFYMGALIGDGGNWVTVMWIDRNTWLCVRCAKVCAFLEVFQPGCFCGSSDLHIHYFFFFQCFLPLGNLIHSGLWKAQGWWVGSLSGVVLKSGEKWTFISPPCIWDKQIMTLSGRLFVL